MLRPELHLRHVVILITMTAPGFEGGESEFEPSRQRPGRALTDVKRAIRVDEALEAQDRETLSSRLLAADPGAGDHVDLANPRRVIRALEIHQLTGETPSRRAATAEAEHVRRYQAEVPFTAVGVDPGSELESRIDRRLQRMREGGLFEEVRRLAPRMGRTASHAVGYRELLEVVGGRADLEQAFMLAARNTKRLARRQRTWFQRDPRIRWIPWVEEVEARAARALFWLVSLFKVFLLQGVLMWVISVPVTITQTATTDLFWLDYAGLAVWLVGLFFEAVGDLQLASFKARPDSKGRVMDRGLWRYTRHPNYFGDFAVWWGHYLVALAGGGWWTIFSPLVMSTLLLRVSGVAMLEKTIGVRRPEYEEYAARTNTFFPGPPRGER